MMLPFGNRICELPWVGVLITDPCGNVHLLLKQPIVLVLRFNVN